MTKNGDLFKTLASLGITRIDSNQFKILDESGSEVEGNKRVYSTVNECLHRLIKEGNPGRFIHITGEMRALADKKHRYVCWEKAASGSEIVNMISSIQNWYPSGETRTPTYWKQLGRRILSQMWDCWGNASWQNHMDALDLLADAEVNLFAIPNEEKIHYSIFENKFILLQAKHSHTQPSKPVWFIESKYLFEQIAPRTYQTLENSFQVPVTVFSELAMSLNSTTALHLLLILADKQIVERKQLYYELKESNKFSDTLFDLEAAHFVNCNQSYVQMTDSGKEYLKLFV